MNLKKSFGLLAAAAVISGVVGCGGKGGNPVITDAAPISGGTPTSVVTSTPAVTGSTGTGTPTTFTAVVAGETKTVTVPATVASFPASTPMAVIPDNVPIIKGDFSRAQGDVEVTCFTKTGQIKSVKTKLSKYVIASNGALYLTAPLGMPAGYYYLSVEGPVYIPNADKSKTLTIGSVGVTFEVTDNGLCSLPTVIGGSLPVNGGNTKGNGTVANITCNKAFAGGSAGLIINFADGRSQTKGVFLDANGKASFSALIGTPVPSTGLDSIQFDIYGPVPTN